MRRRFIDSKWYELFPVFASFTLAALFIAQRPFDESSIALILGVIAGGLVDMDHRTSGRLKNLWYVLLGFSLSSLAVQFTLDSPVLITLVMVALAFITTMLGAIDDRYRTIAFGTLIVALYTALTHHQELAWYVNPLMILAGAVIYHSLTLIVHLLFPNRPVQERLAMAFDALSAYSRIKAQFFNPDELGGFAAAQYQLAQRNQAVTEAFNQCRDRLFNRLSGQARISARNQRLLRDFFIAQDIHERISATHIDYHELAKRLVHSDLIFRIEHLITHQARVCEDYAHCLQHSQPYLYPAALDRALAGLNASWANHLYHYPREPDKPDLQRLLHNLEQINRQLALLGQKATRIDPEDDPQNTLPISLEPLLENTHANSFRQSLQRVREQCTLQSPYFRHALRQAIITLIGCVIIESFDLKMGYWILLTSIFVCQPNYAATQAKLIQRIIGTVAGVIIGSLLPVFAPNAITLLSLLVVSNTLFFYFRLRNYGFSTLFITIQVFLGFALIGMDTQSVLINRLLDTFIGAAIAWGCVSWLWPDWNYLSLKKTTTQAMHHNAAYLRIIFAQLGNTARDDLRYRAERRRVHEQASALATLARDMSLQPKKYGKRVQLTYQLVQLDYRLVALLSALAAFRGALEGQTPDPVFAHSLEMLASLLDELTQLAPDTRKKRLDDLEQQLNLACEQDINPALLHPLLRIYTQLEQQQDLFNQLS